MPRLQRGLATTAVCALGAGVLLATPTAALADDTGIRINEVESNGGTPGDWIEFHNTAEVAIDLAGYVVKDADDDHAYAFPDGTTVEPGAFLVIDELIDGEGQFDFGLGGDDHVRLFDPAGSLVDDVTWPEHAATTWGFDDEAGEWGVTAAATKGAANAFAAAPVVSGVVLNEIIYDDEVTGLADQVELYNKGAEPVDISGWWVTDEKAEEQVAVPAGTVLEPGAFFVIETDVDGGFGLGKGDAAVLHDAADAVVDAYQYENTAPLADWSRCPDGTGDWAHATAATPGAANDCSVAPTPGAVVLNEVDSQPADWVELYNPGDEAFDLSGYELRDNSDDHSWRFLAGTSIGAGEFLVVDEATIGLVDGEEAAFRDPIGIGSADRIRLFDPAGELIDDTQAWEGHAEIDGDFIAATLGRCPDGEGAFVLSYATPGAPNECVLPDVVINEVESNGDATDWIEIVNLGSTAVDISGWTAIDDDPIGHASETTPLPEGTILGAGAYFVFDGAENFVFGLGGGDTATVRDAAGMTVDEYAYPDHAEGVWARCEDGTGEFVDVPVSTKGLRNACGNPVRINEVESDEGEPGDWIELVNPTAEALEVGGILVKDDDDDHAYEIPAGTAIPANGYLVLEEADLGFGLGGDDTVRVFDGDQLVDSTTWPAHAAVTWGRCPDTSGAFSETAESTKGAANVCPGEIPVAPWPGSQDVRVLDEQPMFLEDSSGLDTQVTAEGTFLWAVDNGEGRIWKLNAAADGSVSFVEGWEDGKRVRFQKDAEDAGAAGPDTEGLTIDGDGFVYVASERDNSAKGVNQNVILQVDPDAAAGDLVAAQEWDLTALLPDVGANLGIEAVEWISDDVLAGALFDDNTGAAYDPVGYAGHGDGLFFVAVEDNGHIYAFALAEDGRATLVSEIEPGLAGVMDLAYDDLLGVVWAVCDDGCQGKSAQITFNGTDAPAIAHFARPANMPDINNEGFAVAPASLSVNGERPVWWFADGYTSEALRVGTLPADGGAVDPEPNPQPNPDPEPNPDPQPGDGGDDTGDALPATGAEPPMAGIVLAAVLLLGGALLVRLRHRAAD